VVILYAHLYADIPSVINVAGRFDLKEGLEQRFGPDIVSRVQQGPVTVPAQRDDGRTWTWQLTAEVGKAGTGRSGAMCRGCVG
jgi:hypothetical protein